MDAARQLIPSVPVLPCAAAAQWERMLLSDSSAEWSAMQRAGEAVAAAVLEDFRELGGFPADGRVLVLVGKGHNGGDALLAADALLRRFPAAQAVVLFVFGRTALRPLAQRAWETLQVHAGGRVVSAFSDEVLATSARYALCLDGIFGFQFRVPMDSATATVIATTNAHAGIAVRAAVDLPSGVGETRAGTLFRADFTYATGIVKAPVLDDAVAPAVGRLRYLDLGFFHQDAPVSPDQILTPDLLAPLVQLRQPQTDKRNYGHVLVVGGSRSYPGAVMLAARAALRSGAGLVTALVPATLAPEYAAAQPEVMWVGGPETATGGLAAGTVDLVRERAARATALLIGPGLGAEPEVLATILATVRATNLPVVLDADALRADIVAAVRGRTSICTPHAGEYQRIQSAFFADGKLATDSGVLVLKGPRTKVTASGEAIYHSLFGGPVLARGGSGDMLAGLIAGLLAQTPDEPLLAACRGVVWHGRAADLLARTQGQVAVEISELLHQLGPALHS